MKTNGKRKDSNVKNNIFDPILAIYDNGGKTVDRYTIIFKKPEYGEFDYLVMSADPFHPQGFCQHGSTDLPKSQWRKFGKKISLSDLSKQAVGYLTIYLAQEE